MNQTFNIRLALQNDIPALANIEQVCWPSEIAGSAADISARIAVCPAGQFVIEQDATLLGVIYGQRISQASLLPSVTYQQLTDRGRFTASHQAEGDTFQLVGVSVLPRVRGWGCGRLLVDHAVSRASKMPGVKRVVGITRPVAYRDYQDTPIEQYIQLENDKGQLVDPVLEFHRSGGADILRGIAGYRPGDSMTLGFGVLIEYF